MFEDFVVMTPVQVLEFRVDTVPSFNLPWSQKKLAPRKLYCPSERAPAGVPCYFMAGRVVILGLHMVLVVALIRGTPT